MEEIQVRAVSKNYRVIVGEGALELSLPGMLSERDAGQVVVVSHPRIISLHGRLIDGIMREAGQKSWQKRCFLFPEGEEQKRPLTVSALHELLLEWQVTRNGVIIAFGGGVVGDLAGFAAATYMRGVDLIQLPTTLMSMVDSSVGGKVGVDMPGAKNAVGAFHQPVAVISDTGLLSTLPKRELLGGLAEVIKYGFLYDPYILRLRGGLEGWSRLSGSEREKVIAACVRLKAAVVEKDEEDVTGERAALNYGHTFGHALEAVTGYSRFRHGEAVAVGMIMAACLAEMTGTAVSPLLELHQDLLLPLLEEAPSLAGIEASQMLDAMNSDKKRGKDKRFVLLEKLHHPVIVGGIPDGTIKKAIGETLRKLKGFAV